MRPKRVSVVTTAPALEPITDSEAKAHCRIEESAEDTLVSVWVKAARMEAEELLGRSLITQTRKQYLDWFPCAIELLYGPVLTVTSIAYVDTAGDSQALAGSVYQLSTTSEPACIVEAYGQSWPVTRDQLDAVTVTYTAGYGATAASVPEPIRQAIRILVGHHAENREASTREMQTVEALIAPYRAVQALA